MNENLPTSELKEYGIMSDDNTFSKKLSEKDIENFLKGHAMIADNGKDRLIFLLTDNNTRLNVNVYQRDRTIDELVKQSQKEIVYSNLTELTNSKALDIEKKAFIYDQKTKQVTELDLLKDTEKIAAIVAEKKDIQESNRFKNELLKLKGYLQDKIDKFPEIGKEITNNLNIVSKTINTIDDATPNESQSQKQQQSKLRLDVNDDDLYQDANRHREEQAQEQEQEQQRHRGFRR
ncbi:hypothetical protein HMPREF9075_02394 [Capnocytophaga sp. oral taxon 332 str. F0381]|uniref:hypothetical protein n=1 Tax=Capnocytophaga sp. oral taxon 332 TaxID=712213 RepID=UPI0002A1E7B5|nr:hypothetical protein [Capnocytophaga sp. oral taxon 332]EKY06359.1 hypothetical protein HMPREF9075_02394 [Capnocytophaga sp. oral taxon 332 str. F0381]